MSVSPHEIDVLNLAVLSGKVFRGKAQVTAYVDMVTGEVVSAAEARKLGVRSIRSDARSRRTEKLDSLRVEVRAFAVFLLGFRDGHCKFLVPMDQLVKWYALITGKTPSNVRRYFVPLVASGILDTEDILNEDFMLNNFKAGKETAKGDWLRALNRLDTYRARHKPSKSLTFSI